MWFWIEKKKKNTNKNNNKNINNNNISAKTSTRDLVSQKPRVQVYSQCLLRRKSEVRNGNKPNLVVPPGIWQK